MRSIICLALIISFLALGCSGGESTVSAPGITDPAKSNQAINSHGLWGLWQGVIDTQAEMIEFVPLRIAELHLNALPFLEPPLYLYLSVEHLQFNGDEIEVDIGLRHPFLGLNQFTGFDVCGIFITNGSVTGFSDPAIMMPGEGETRLLNPDGYSRWWNPTEFPVNPGTIKGYTDGLLGNPYSVAEFNCTLNGYKYFCDDLAEITDTLDAVTLENRGMFNAGQKNVRCYIIKLGAGGLVFNYAVDACWKFPTGGAPWEIPGDFPPKANREEAWRISVNEIENTLYNDGVDNGGDLSLSIDVYDWFNADMNSVRVESPGNFTMLESATPISGGAGYSTYEIEINGATPAEGEIDLLVSVISEQEDFGGFITGTNTTSYFTYAAEVAGESPAGYHWEFDEIDIFAGTHSSNPGVSEFEDISPALIEETDNDIALTWAATDTYDIYTGWDSVFWVMRSTDNGVTYGNLKYGDIASDNLPRDDRNKIAYGNQADGYAVSGFCDNNTGTYITRVEDGHPNWAVWVSYNATNIDIFVDPEGWIYNFDDSGDYVKLKHSQTPENLWHEGVYSWSGYTTYTVAEDALVSHSRSTSIDSSGTMWIAVHDIGMTEVRLSHSTDAPPHEVWDDSTIVYTADVNTSNVENPSLWIDDDDTFHICYTRLGILTGERELVYAKDDSAFDDPAEQVIFGAPGEINDAHIAVGEKFGEEVVIIVYEWGSSIYLYTIVGGTPIGPPEQVDMNTDDIDCDAILDTDECDFHAVWSTMDDTNYDIARRNGVLVEG